ncbi:GTPase-activating Rap/Ran-GAP domain-like protein 3 isoform X2 [Onychomys torridus]|uniref:GTPase-activating Rap/Ran-GAP domain-like protein 3 isoform X2 n=1 Tax=Onychomys torridus TaxID=38674 RepID=UPI00167F9185|nr:GTPase-activating Rap/Ran-GAP domain-like protein 3 isoform X2 [Onychomys torridus]
MEPEPGGAAAALLRQKRAALRRRGCSFESPSTASQPPGPLMDPLTKGSCGSQLAQTLLWKAKSSLSFGIQPLQTWPTKDPELESQVNLSVSEDLGCRRGDFSRKHYGSVELSAAALPGTWRRTDVHLENPEYHTRWYFKYFLGQVHQNYIGNDAEKSPFFLSVTLSDQNHQRVPQYRAILWRKTGTQKLCLPYSPTKTLSVKSILSAMNLDKFEKGPREIFHPEIQKDLLVLEEQEGSVNFKFGVLFAKDGQLTDDEMFSNEIGSEAFQKFLNLLGDTITLKGWTGYRGGLDTKNNTTGINSVYTVYQGHEVMFHVSTMLPYSKENRQQVERKRHIGNDIVTIVFQEGEESSPAFKPSMIRSHFTHIFALVRYDQKNDNYRLKIFSEESVPLFGPPLPSPPVFTDHQEFRDFLLVKLINGEKATLETPTFAQKRRRTLDMLIRSLYQDLMPDLHKNMLNRRSFSDVLPESPKSARKKEEARQAEFVRIGQALKLKSIVRGDAPSSLAASGMCKKEPWEPQCFCSNFPHEAVCADPWGQALLVSTDAGVLLVDDGLPSVPVFDRTLPVKQIHVLETLDLLVLRADKGKDARLFVFRLSAVQKGLDGRPTGRSRSDCRENKLEKTKGCHLYAINTHHSRELRIVVAIRNKLLLITRKQHNKPSGVPGASLLSPLPESPVEEFQYIREICLCDSPAVMTLVDGPTEESDNLICVAYRHQFDVVNESTGEAFRLHHVEANKVNFVAAIDVYEDGEAGLLLCYNYSCIYKKVCPFNGGSFLLQPSASDFQFCWNQAPYAIVCAFPYLLAFTTDSMEIRLVVNGNLVHTAVVPQLQLVASRSDIYFTAATAVQEGSSAGSSKGASAHTSPQTPPARDTLLFPSSLGEGEIQSKNLYRIPLRNLVGRSIERPLKSPLVSKVITPPTSIGLGTAAIPVTHSLSLSRMEIKEIASRTRRELLGLSDDGGPRSEGAAPRAKSKTRKRLEESQGDPKPEAVRSASSDRIPSVLESPASEANAEGHNHSASSDQDPVVGKEGSSGSGSSPFQLMASSEEDIIDLK